MTLTEQRVYIRGRNKLEEKPMYYIIQFYKPTSADRKLEERFSRLSAVKRWERLVKKNGYEVETITKKTGEKL